jgi:surface antigen
MKTLTRSLTALTLTASLAGCASSGGYGGFSNYPYRNTVTGAAVGAAGGALLGHVADDGHGNGTLVGGALGAVVGGAAGYALDHKEKNDAYRGQPYYDPRPQQRYPYYGR